MKKSYSSAERKSYKRGFFAGLFASKKKKKVVKKPAVKRKQSPSVWHNQHFDDPLYKAAYRYAKYCQSKCRDIPGAEISDDEALKNARSHYNQALKDKKYRDHLTFEFGD